MRIYAIATLFVVATSCIRHPPVRPLAPRVISDYPALPASQPTSGGNLRQPLVAGSNQPDNNTLTSDPGEPTEPLIPINRVLEDAFFDFDRYQLRTDAVASLQADASQLRLILERQPALMLLVEGHCDEAGSAEYNLGLGERRAEVARDFLVQLGIPAGRLRTVSWGKERPICTEANEACRQKNRRAHVMYLEK